MQDNRLRTVSALEHEIFDSTQSEPQSEVEILRASIANGLRFGIKPKPKTGPLESGTILLAMKCKDGLVLACDGRTSSGSGLYRVTESPHTRKMKQIAPGCFMMGAGMAAHNFWARHFVPIQASYNARSRRGREAMIRDYAHHAKQLWASFGGTSVAIIAGVDDSGACIYFIDRFGFIKEQKLATICGSGSRTIAPSVRAAAAKDLPMSEAMDEAQKQIHEAIKHDIYCGGTIYTVGINSTTREVIYNHKNVSI